MFIYLVCVCMCHRTHVGQFVKVSCSVYPGTALRALGWTAQHLDLVGCLTGPPSYISETWSLSVMATLGYQLDYVWNELQSKNGGHGSEGSFARFEMGVSILSLNI